MITEINSSPVSVSLKELVSLYRRIGFLEGALDGIRLSSDQVDSVDRALERYRETCDESQQ